MSNDLKVEGKPSKRYGVSYGGNVIGSFDTAKEALEARREHEERVRSTVDPKKKHRYSFRDGNKEISMEQLAAVAAKAKK